MFITHAIFQFQILDYLPQLCFLLLGYFKINPHEAGKHFAHVCSDGNELGFDRPRLALKFCKTTKSVLDEDPYSDESLTGDSLNGACQFGKSEPSPFSARKNMYGKEEADRTEDSETRTVSEEVRVHSLNTLHAG